MRTFGSQFRFLSPTTAQIACGFVLMAIMAALGSSQVSAQSVETYAYVHKKQVELTSPPWQCLCYSASTESVIMTHQSANQVWVVERYNTMEAALAARDALNAGPGVCSFCPGAGGTRAQFFVFQNCSSGQCEIGVADGTYDQPDWFVSSAPFESDRDAWRHACQLHQNGQAFSPDISNNRIDCTQLAQSGGNGGGGNDGNTPVAGTKYNWEVCRRSDGSCQPSRACVATFAEAEALLKSGGHEGTWYLTGETSRVCSGGSANEGATAAANYNWEVCRHSDNRCQPSQACVATFAEAEALLKSGGHEGTWYLTGNKSRPC